MKRLHIHLSVKNLKDNIDYYSKLFASEPSVSKDDYAKWMLADPKINFAISTRSDKIGLDHLGIQVDNDAQLQQLQHNMRAANSEITAQLGQGCCYSISDKYWSTDPQGIPWEGYHTLKSIPTFSGAQQKLTSQQPGSCCASNSSDDCCG